jgi:hypothetical protein
MPRQKYRDIKIYYPNPIKKVWNSEYNQLTWIIHHAKGVFVVVIAGTTPWHATTPDHTTIAEVQWFTPGENTT